MTNVPETQKGNWDDDFASTKDDRSNDRKLPYIAFDAEGDVDIRLVGSYVTFLQHWSPPFDKPMRTHKEYEAEDPAWQAGFKPRMQCAIHVIDRRDGQLKILQKSWTFFKAFKAFKDRENQEPNSTVNSPDFTVTVEWPNGNKRQAKYTVNARRKDSPLTDEEKAMIKEKHIKLSEFFKPYQLSYIQQQWDALPDDKKIPPKDDSAEKKDNKSTTASTPSIDESVGTDDSLFKNDESESAEAVETEGPTSKW